MYKYNRRLFFRNSAALLGALSFSLSPTLMARAAGPAISRQTLYLWPENSPNDHVHEIYGRPRLELFLPETADGQPRAAMVICPSGSYYQLAENEGVPVAEFLAAQGLVAAVLTYRLHPHRYPKPFADVARALRLLRLQADELNLAPQKIGIMGFSAGGHLAATLATRPDLYRDPEDQLAGIITARPDRLVLAYPVISFQKEYGQLGAAEGLLGKDPSPKLLNHFSNELHVNVLSPPAFVFHTADDPVVRVEHSLQFATAYQKLKLPLALHVYPSGSHGVGLAKDDPELQSWTSLLLDWLGDWKTQLKA